MEPLTKENEKLKEAVKLMEKNVQRAQHVRDLAESNPRDLKYQKGALSEQLATMSEQLWGSSEQLRSLFRAEKRYYGSMDLFCITDHL